VRWSRAAADLILHVVVVVFDVLIVC